MQPRLRPQQRHPRLVRGSNPKHSAAALGTEDILPILLNMFMSLYSAKHAHVFICWHCQLPV
jgi:hypothetical protein